jgi:hypothetical protein
MSAVDDPRLRPTAAARMSGRAADIAAAAWGSFLAACLGAFVCFALIDPGRLGDASDVLGDVGRMTGYGVLFFFFWLISGAGAAVTLLLIRTSRREMRRRAHRRLARRAPDANGDEAVRAFDRTTDRTTR